MTSHMKHGKMGYCLGQGVGAAGNAYKVLIEKSQGTGYSEDLHVDGKILLK